MARVAVTGASGFLGRPLCEELARAGHLVVPVTSRNGDIAAPSTLRSVGTADHVFHLAARTFVPDSWNDPAEFHRVNVIGTLNVLEFCRAANAGLTFVSAYLYGVPAHLPIAETDLRKPNNPYALSKHLAEQACEFYATHHGVRTAIVRPFNIYGPGQGAHFLIPHVVQQVLAGREIRVKDLAPRRDYVHVDDVVDALVKCMNVRDAFVTFNIASGHSVSVADVVDIAQAAAGTHLPVYTENSVRMNELDDVYADVSRARDALGWAPRITLPEGIAQLLHR